MNRRVYVCLLSYVFVCAELYVHVCVCRHVYVHVYSSVCVCKCAVMCTYMHASSAYMCVYQHVLVWASRHVHLHPRLMCAHVRLAAACARVSEPPSMRACVGMCALPVHIYTFTSPPPIIGESGRWSTHICVTHVAILIRQGGKKDAG